MTDRKVQDCLNGNHGSYIFPLVWYAGEDRKLVEREIRAVKAGGIDEFVLENRGGNWFCRQPWWDIMDTALETAKELNMRM